MLTANQKLPPLLIFLLGITSCIFAQNPINTEITSFEYPIEQCFTYTYQLRIGDNGYKTVVTETITAENGEIYNTGYVEDAMGNRKGMLQQIDHAANITWTKYFSFPDRSISFNNIHQLPGGRLLLAGNSENAGSGKNALFTALNEDGVLQWCTSIMNRGFDAVATCIDSVPGLPSGIGFAAQNGNAVMYGKLFNNGQVAWARETGDLGIGEITGMGTSANSSWFFSYNTQEAGIGVGLILRVNLHTGNLFWVKKFGGPASGKEYIFRESIFHNNSFRVAALIKNGTGPYKIGMLSLRDEGSTEQDLLIETPAINLQSTAKIAVDQQYDVVAFTAGQNEQEVYLAKMKPWAYTTPLTGWAKKYNFPGNHNVLNTDRCFDGGFIISGNAVSASGESVSILLKTDSTGNIKNCEGTDVVLNASLAVHDYTNLSIAIIPVALQLQQETPLIAEHAMLQTFSCKSLNCLVLPTEDACLASFSRQYNSGALVDVANSVISFPTENIIAGSTRSLSSLESDRDHAILVRLNNNGKVIDRKKIQFGKNTVFSHLLKLADGNFIALGNSVDKSENSTYDTSYLVIAKFSPTLQLLESTAFPRARTSGMNGILESADGNIFLSILDGADVFNMNPRLIKLNSQLQLIWAKSYTMSSGSCLVGNIGNITQDEEYLYLMNFGSCDLGNVFLKIEKLTGNCVFAKGFNFNGSFVQWQGGLNMELMGDKIVMQGYLNVTGDTKDITYILDKNGNVLRMKVFSYQFDQGLYFKQKVLQNKEIILLSHSGLRNNTYFLRLDSNLNILRSRQTKSPGIGFADITEDGNGSIITIGTRWYEDPYIGTISFTRFDYDGHIGSCFSDTLILNEHSLTFNETPLTATGSNFPVLFRPLPFQISSYSLQDAGLLCSQVSNCNTLQLAAPATVCDTMPHVATAIKNIGCSLPVSFTYDNPNFIITERTDTSIKFKIMQPGSTMLVASIFTGCTWVRDTTFISSTSVDFSLGNDTAICVNNSLLLDAGPGFTSYEWNDGSTQQQLLLNTPGMYFVKLRDACGNILSDTILISHKPVPVISLGNDTSICNAAVLQLTAIAGFMSYQWQPAYQLTPISVNNHQVSVAPMVDTAYSVRVEYATGCYAYDTIKIKVNYSAPIHLGPDKSFCVSDSVVLDAGAGFANYIWNTGAGTQIISAHHAGDYTVIATDTNGCQSKDTVVVTDVYANPDIQLGGDFSLCKGALRTLNAGNFSSYVWNDGSTNRELVVSIPGTYYVTVTDSHQCKGTDTVHLNTIWPLPEKFLPSDTSICKYGSIVLSSIYSYDNYSWSNNSEASSITVTQPGLYWLSVKDRNGCNGKDSVLVNPKQCMEGFYIPNTFSPNNDGRNDDFKPLLFGDIQEYTFQIYNRYGQRVFYSNEPGKGWNGTYGSATQNSGGYVWLCRYRLKNAEAKTEKGTVILVR